MIRKHVILKVESSILVSDYRAVVRDILVKTAFQPKSPWVSIIDNYYFWGFHNLIASVCKGIWHRGYHHPFDLFFDEQLIDGPVARKSYVIVKDVASAL